MTHSCVTWLIHAWHDVFICGMMYSGVTGRIHMWGATFVTWLVHMCHCSCIRDANYTGVAMYLWMTWRIYTRHDAFIRDVTDLCVPWCFHTWNGPFIRCTMRSCLIWCICVIEHIHMQYYAFMWCWTIHSYMALAFMTWRNYTRCV